MNLSIKQELEARYKKEVWIDTTLGEALENWAEKYQDKVAVKFDQVDYSYKDLNEKASRAANGLLKMGLKPGEHIVVQLPNSYEFIALVFGMFKAGIIPIFALPAQRKNEIYGILKNADATEVYNHNSVVKANENNPLITTTLMPVGYEGTDGVSSSSAELTLSGIISKASVSRANLVYEYKNSVRILEINNTVSKIQELVRAWQKKPVNILAPAGTQINYVIIFTIMIAIAVIAIGIILIKKIVL